MKYRIHTYGDPALRRKAEPAAVVDDSIRKLGADMLEIMKNENGIGLAAQQIGEHIRVCVINIPYTYDTATPDGDRLNPHVEMPLVLINPEIVEQAGSQKGEESCLSIPEISAPVERAFELTISFLDDKGEKQRLVTKGFLARVIQHELDHLNGMLFIDRVSPAKKVVLSGKLKRLKEKQSPTSLKDDW